MTTTFGRSTVLFRFCKQPFSHVDTVKHIMRTSPIVIQNNYIQRAYKTTNAQTVKRHAIRAKKLQDMISKKKRRTVADVWTGITVNKLANAINRNVEDVIEALEYATNHNFKRNEGIENRDTLQSISSLLNATFRFVQNPSQEIHKRKESDIHQRKPVKDADLIKRNPIVTVMGHVDHGKTTLLDALRSSSVAASEFGGITQHIGAFNVTLKTGAKITFLDTPGHAAFSALRGRGARVTDIVILVVAADDGVMAQTVQSINMAKAAKVPIVVAINKIDKPNANIKRTMNMLASHKIMVEEMGGDVQAVQISALKKTNLDLLIETITLQAELLNLKGDPKGLAEGVVIEASTTIAQGKVATALVQRGKLRKGTIIVCGTAWAKVKSMNDDDGKPRKEAGLSDAVRIIGWKAMPSVGEMFFEVENEVKARRLVDFREDILNRKKIEDHNEGAQLRLAELREEYIRVRELKAKSRNMLEVKMAVDNKVDDTPKVNVVVKGDVVGSVEAILNIFQTYNQTEACQLNVISHGVGDIAEADITLAEACNGIVYRFNVNVSAELTSLAQEKNVPVRPFNVIYKLIDDIKVELNDKMPMIKVEDIHGEAVIKKVFEVTEKKKKVSVAGCLCTTGILKLNSKYRIVRDGEIIYTGNLASMKHLKEEVSTIKVNTECGLRFHKPTIAFQEGDVVICFTEKIQREELKWDPGF